MKQKPAILFLLVFTSILNAQSLPIFLDGRVDDWNVAVPTYIDNEGDGNDYDFRNFSVTNDEEFLFIKLDLSPECELTEGNNLLSLYIDGDNDSTTGLAINGIGAELEWDFGERTGVFYKNVNTALTYPDIVYRSLPTVSDTIFEIAIGRNALPNGTDSLFTSSAIKIFFRDNSFNGDWMPDSGTTFKYTFDNTPTPPVDLIEISKEDTSFLRVMDWNVSNDGLTSSSRQQYFARILKAVNPDIICLSECVNSTAPEVKQALDLILPLTNSYGWYTMKMDYDDVIASRYSILQGWTYDPDGRSFGSLIDLPDYYGKDLLTINAHLKCCGGQSNDDRRQREVDAIISFLKDAKTEGGNIDLTEDTPFIIMGDLNFVGLRQQLVSLLTGEIINTGQFGVGGPPDWDDSDLEDLIAQQTDKRTAYTWRDDGSSYSPGRLDFQIFTNSVLNVKKAFVIQTEVMSPERLAQYSLQQFDTRNASDHFPKVTDYSFNIPTNVNDKITPDESRLDQNFPNPFNPSTIIKYSVPGAGFVSIAVYDILGREVTTLVNEYKPAGKFSVKFNATNLPSGVYVYQLKVGGFIETKKMVLLK